MFTPISTTMAITKYSADNSHRLTYISDTCDIVEPLLFISTNPSIPHVAGTNEPTICHNSGIAYRGHVNPDKKMNSMDVITHIRNTDSRSFTTPCIEIPMNIHDMLIGSK